MAFRAKGAGSFSVNKGGGSASFGTLKGLAEVEDFANSMGVTSNAMQKRLQIALNKVGRVMVRNAKATRLFGDRSGKLRKSIGFAAETMGAGKGRVTVMADTDYAATVHEGNKRSYRKPKGKKFFYFIGTGPWAGTGNAISGKGTRRFAPGTKFWKLKKVRAMKPRPFLIEAFQKSRADIEGAFETFGNEVQQYIINKQTTGRMRG